MDAYYTAHRWVHATRTEAEWDDHWVLAPRVPQSEEYIWWYTKIDSVTGWADWMPCESLVIMSADHSKHYRSADGRPYYVNSDCAYYADQKNWIGKKSFLMPTEPAAPTAPAVSVAPVTPAGCSRCSLHVTCGGRSKRDYYFVITHDCEQCGLCRFLKATGHCVTAVGHCRIVGH